MRQESAYIYASLWNAPPQRGVQLVLLTILIVLQACLMWAVLVALPRYISRTQTAQYAEYERAIRFITAPPPVPNNTTTDTARSSALQSTNPRRASPPTATVDATSSLPTSETPIDWAAERERAVANIAAYDAPTYRQFGPRAREPPAPTPKEFAWDKTHTQRIEHLPNGGTLIRINDHCVLVIAPFPLPICGLGKRAPRGDLFDGMRPPATPGDWKDPALP